MATAAASSSHRQGKLGTEAQTPVVQCSLAREGGAPPSLTNLLDDVALPLLPQHHAPSPPRAGICLAEGAVHRPPNLAGPGSREGGKAGLAGWLGAEAQQEEGLFNKEREETEESLPLTTDLTAYLKADVCGLTYFWKR